MFYYTCPHCDASLSVAIKWDSISCPFCKGEIIFPNVAYVTQQEFLLWSMLQHNEFKSQKNRK